MFSSARMKKGSRHGRPECLRSRVAAFFAFSPPLPQKRHLHVLLVATLFAAAAALPSAARAEEPAGISLDILQSTKDSLLLFWDEKDLYVESATRIPKHIDQAAENIVVITASDIEQMNAHTLAEVLSTVPGMYVIFSGRDFGSSALVQIQGSEERHVTLLMDGIVWNFLASNNADWNQIPVRIIDRIEIIKGPASSAWGSSLGGIVNVITKGAGGRSVPQGTVVFSGGEGTSLDYSAEAYGKGGPAGYYLFAGRQESRGISSKGFDKNSFYGKTSFSLTDDATLHVAAGYSDPVVRHGSVADGTTTLPKTAIRSFHATAGLDYRISEQWRMQGNFSSLNQHFDALVDITAPGFQLGQQLSYREQTYGGSLRLLFTGSAATAAAGAEYAHGTLDQDVTLTSTPGNDSVSTRPSIDRWALFTNATLTAGSFAFTPGLRLDTNNITGTFLSPSFGATWEITEHTIARASVARGFTTPPLAWMSGGGFGFSGNGDLSEERVWSYQAGLETGLLRYLSLQGSVFHHDMKGEMRPVPDPAAPSRAIFINNGSVKRTGYEVFVETAPVFNVSAGGGFSWVRKKADSVPDPVVQYSANTAVKYDDRKSLAIQLIGTYVKWQTPGSTHNFLWDLNATHRLFSAGTVNGEVFASIHNLFNGTAYEDFRFPNVRRWIEGGIRLTF